MKDGSLSPTMAEANPPPAAEGQLGRDLWKCLGLAGILLAGMILAGVVYARGQRILSNDSFCYLAYAKQFKEHLPTRLGDWWPFGFPVAGALVSQLTGVSAHAGLFVVSALAYGSVLAGFFLVLPPALRTRASTLACAAALACAPVCLHLLYATMSEPLFAAALFWLAVSLAYWPRPAAVVLSAGLALIAFCTRYAGIFALGVVALHALMNFKRLRQTRSVMMVAAIYGLAVVAAFGLMYTNYRVFGHATGPQPVGKESFLSWPVQLADFGWSPVGSFISVSALKAVGGIRSWAGLLLGWTSEALMLGLCAHAWRQDATKASKPLALTAAAYVLSIVTLRSTTPFEALSTPRTFLPVLFLLGVLAFQTVIARGSRALFLGACLSVVLSLLLAARGWSKELYGDVSYARMGLARVITRESSVAVNGPAASLAAYFPNHFFPVASSEDGLIPAWGPTARWDPQKRDFTVIVPRRTGRFGREACFEGNWLKLVSSALASNKASLVESNADCIILRSTSPSSRNSR